MVKPDCFLASILYSTCNYYSLNHEQDSVRSCHGSVLGHRGHACHRLRPLQTSLHQQGGGANECPAQSALPANHRIAPVPVGDGGHAQVFHGEGEALRERLLFQRWKQVPFELFTKRL